MSLYDSLQRVSGVYIIRNTSNGDSYVGSSFDVGKRLTTHKASLRKGNHHSIYLQRAWNKYGDVSFECELLETCSVDELINKEQKWINRLVPKYNMSKYASSGMKGRKHSESTRNKIKEILRKKFTKDDFVKRAKHAGEFVTKESIKIAQEKLRIIRKSGEYKEKTSKSQKSLWDDPAHREKMSNAHKNPSLATRKKMSDAQKRLWENPEYYNKASISRRGKGKARHTKEEVVAIRKMHFVDKLSAREISKNLNEPYRTIRSILYNNWKWIKDE